MAEPTAVLSYTRKDDEFFGGYITAFRKTLESAVHVVTGREDFRMFQDVEGIVIGEQWQKKLAEVIGSANFLVPMVSPLFFNSEPCREEVALFLAHERHLQRDDLILPVYFLSSPKLEKDEEKGKDPIATELARRQMFDWREKANLPLQEPAARSAMLSLASAVGAAIERVDASRGTTPPERVGVRAARTLTENVPVAREHGQAHRETPSERVILWVDDNPDNNRWERRALEAYGVRFEPRPTPSRPWHGSARVRLRPSSPTWGAAATGRPATHSSNVCAPSGSACRTSFMRGRARPSTCARRWPVGHRAPPTTRRPSSRWWSRPPASRQVRRAGPRVPTARCPPRETRRSGS